MVTSSILVVRILFGSLSFVAPRRLLLSRISHATRWFRHSATCQQRQQQQQPLVRRRLHRSSIGNDRSRARLLAVVCLPLVLFASSIPSPLVSSCLFLSPLVSFCLFLSRCRLLSPTRRLFVGSRSMEAVGWWCADCVASAASRCGMQVCFVSESERALVVGCCVCGCLCAFVCVCVACKVVMGCVVSERTVPERSSVGRAIDCSV